MDLTPSSQTLVTLSAALGFVAIKYARRWFRHTFLIPKFTVLQDIPHIGTVRPNGKLAGQAVVCGGSVAGILAAAVLSNHYEEVLIVEPEAWLASKEGTTVSNSRKTLLNEAGIPGLTNKRSRVMQNTSFHGYLPVLTPILHKLFPNFSTEIEELGLSSKVGDCEYKFHISGCAMPPRPLENENRTTTYFTRETFEKVLRRCLFNSRPNVRQVVGHAISAARSTKYPSLLHEVVIKTPEGSQRTENAAIVIDATGPTQAGLKILQRLELPLPPSMRLQYTAQLHYSTMTFVVPPDLQDRLPIPGGWRNNHFIYTFVPDTEIEPRAVTLAIFENSQLMAFCGGWDIEVPASSLSDFEATAADLKCAQPVPQFVFDICDMLQDHIEEIDPAIVIKRLPPSTYTLYHKLAETPGFPSNFIALGDAAMVVNPFFGQGCAKAAVNAVTLDHFLHRSDPSTNNNFSAAYFKKDADRVDAAWNMNKHADYGFASTIPVEGEAHSEGAFGRWLAKQLLIMARTDAKLCWNLWEIRWLLAPPTDVMTPTILARAVWTWLTN